MLKLTCPRALFSIPLLKLSQESNVVEVCIVDTGRSALEDLLNGNADVALATSSAYQHTPSKEKTTITTIGEMINHKMAANVYCKTGLAKPNNVTSILNELEQNERRATFFVQSQTNYSDKVNSLIEKYGEQTCFKVDTSYSTEEISTKQINEILSKQTDYLICLGLNSWIDFANETFINNIEFKKSFCNMKRFSEGFGKEHFWLYADKKSLVASESNKLKSIREIIINLGGLAGDVPRIISQMSLEIDETILREILDKDRPGDIERYLKNMGLAIKPKLMWQIIETWKNEAEFLLTK